MSYIIYIVDIIYNYKSYKISIYIEYYIISSYISYDIGDILYIYIVYYIIIRQHTVQCVFFSGLPGQVETTLTPVDIGKTIAISPAFHLKMAIGWVCPEWKGWFVYLDVSQK